MRKFNVDQLFRVQRPMPISEFKKINVTLKGKVVSKQKFPNKQKKSFRKVSKQKFANKQKKSFQKQFLKNAFHLQVQIGHGNITPAVYTA